MWHMRRIIFKGWTYCYMGKKRRLIFYSLLHK
jgi:hypothetical protein